MKKIQGFLSGLVALAAGVSLADSNGVTAFDSLKLSTATNAFSVTASATNGCEVTAVPEKVSIAGGYFVIESDLSETTAPFAVAQNPKVANSIEKFDVSFKASFVDETDLATAAATSGAKIGFALTAADAASYYDGSSWATLTNAADVVKLNVTEDDVLNLHIDYDAREATKKARFVLDTTPAYTSRWVSVGTVANNAIAVLGSGSVASLAGANYTIAAEVIIITPPGGSGSKNVEFSTKQMEALREQVGGDASVVAAKLNSTTAQNNGLKPMDNFVLFGTVKDSEITESTKPLAKGVPLAPSDANKNKVKIELPNVNVQQVGGASVSFQLQGSTDNANWTNVGEAKSTPELEFDTSTGFRYFKVVTTITYQ